MNEQQALGYRIKAMRFASDITQTELEEDTGLSKTYVSEIENGHRSPGYTVILRLCRALGVTPNQLAGWEELPDQAARAWLELYAPDVSNGARQKGRKP